MLIVFLCFSGWIWTPTWHVESFKLKRLVIIYLQDYTWQVTYFLKKEKKIRTKEPLDCLLSHILYELVLLLTSSSGWYTSYSCWNTDLRFLFDRYPVCFSISLCTSEISSLLETAGGRVECVSKKKKKPSHNLLLSIRVQELYLLYTVYVYSRKLHALYSICYNMGNQAD